MPGSSNSNAIGVGLLGVGVVGSAVASAIAKPVKGAPNLELTGALVRDLSKSRSADLAPGALTADPDSVLDDPRAEIIVELMGGEWPAFDYISRALKAGKHVVTANKEVIAKRGEELRDLARRNGASLQYEASVGGGIPIINPLLNDLSANNVLGLRAIINGTTNYILTRMEKGGVSFEGALSEAQGLGYAEADPTADVDGYDAVYKIAILARLAFGVVTPVESVHREGIRGVQSQDFRYASNLGYTIKLLAVAQREESGLLVRVNPALVPLEVPMAKVDGVLNVVEAEGDLVGPLWIQGRGAGPSPTASAVMADTLRAARIARSGGEGLVPRPDGSGLTLLAMDSHVCKYYLRLVAMDQPGVLARIGGILGERDISIASVLQMDADGGRGTADVVIMTHPAREANMQKAVEEIDRLTVIDSVANLIRVESYSP
ncbi:MAG: homoserine dehydrogenase [Chloroflexota bacterium]